MFRKILSLGGPVFLTIIGVLLALTVVSFIGGERSIPNDDYVVLLVVIAGVVFLGTMVGWFGMRLVPTRIAAHFGAADPVDWGKRISGLVAVLLAYVAGLFVLVPVLTRCCGVTDAAAGVFMPDGRTPLYLNAIILIFVLTGIVHVLVHRARFSYLFVVLAIVLSGLLVPASWVAWGWFSGMSELVHVQSIKGRELFAAERAFETDLELRRLATARDDDIRRMKDLQSQLRAVLPFSGPTLAHSNALRAAKLGPFLDFDIQFALQQTDDVADIWLENVQNHIEDHSHAEFPRSIHSTLERVDRMATEFVFVVQDFRALDGKRQEAEDAVRLAAVRFDQAAADVLTLRSRLIIPLWGITLMGVLFALLISVIVLHFAQLRWREGAFFTRASRLGLGYAVMFYAFTPFVLLAVVACAAVSFGQRVSVSAEQIGTEVQYIASEVAHDVEVFRNFARTESARVRQIINGVTALEQRVVGEAINEIGVVKDEIAADFTIAKNAVLNVEQEVVGEIKGAIGSVVDKITGAFKFKLPIIGNIDLGIGKLLGKLIPNFHFEEALKKAGMKIISGLKQPFVEPLQRLNALETQIVDLANKEVLAVKNLINDDVMVIRSDIAALKAELKRSQVAFLRDIYRLIDEAGDILHHVLWIITVIVILLLSFFVYLFFGAILSFWLRVMRGWELLFGAPSTPAATPKGGVT